MHMLVITAKLTVSFTNSANFNACSSYNYVHVCICVQGDDINEVMKQTLSCFGYL